MNDTKSGGLLPTHGWSKGSNFAAWSCSTLLITSLQGVITPHNKILSVWTKAWGVILTVVTVVQKGSCYNLGIVSAIVKYSHSHIFKLSY